LQLGRACNSVQGATAFLAFTATLALWNLKLTESKRFESHPLRHNKINSLRRFSRFALLGHASAGACCVFVVLAHDRRRILHVHVTPHPTSTRTRQQLREAFPWHVTFRFMLHDRDAIFDVACRSTVADLGLTEVRTAPRSPWHNPFVERVIGSIRRECLDDVNRGQRAGSPTHPPQLRRVLTIGRVRTWRSRRTLPSCGRSMPLDVGSSRYPRSVAYIIATSAAPREPTAGFSNHSAVSPVGTKESIADTVRSLRLAVGENGIFRKPVRLVVAHPRCTRIRSQSVNGHPSPNFGEPQVHDVQLRADAALLPEQAKIGNPALSCDASLSTGFLLERSMRSGWVRETGV
jgi:transposase InsO family protein